MSGGGEWRGCYVAGSTYDEGVWGDSRGFIYGIDGGRCARTS